MLAAELRQRISRILPLKMADCVRVPGCQKLQMTAEPSLAQDAL